MESYKYTSIQTLLAKVSRDLGVRELNQSTVPEAFLIEWICEAYLEIGFNKQYVHKEHIIPKGKHKYRSELPCDLVYLQMVHYNNIPLFPATQEDRMKWLHPDKILSDPVIPPGFATTTLNGTPLTDGVLGDAYFYNPRANADMDLRYYIDEEQMFCTLFDGMMGEFYLSYQAIPVDEQGIPLVLDNVYLHNAITAYVVMKKEEAPLIQKGDYRGLQFLEQRWARKKQLCIGQMALPTLDQRQNLSMIWMRLIPNSTGFNSPNGMGNINSPINRFF